jgi:endogenous inhibitor of DNA gyrase (YacG/DUF329 family)
MASNPANTRDARCPICSRPTDVRYRPFCSRRCADIDLSRWLGGAYAIPGETKTDEGQSLGGSEPTNGEDGPKKH